MILLETILLEEHRTPQLRLKDGQQIEILEGPDCQPLDPFRI